LNRSDDRASRGDEEVGIHDGGSYHDGSPAKPPRKGKVPSAEPLPLQQPRPGTLRRYGLSLEEWEAIADRQGRVCGVCGGLPASGRLQIDHDHVKGWKKMTPTDRKRYVRGLACFPCNSRHLSRGMTTEKARAIAGYLEAYGQRFLAPASANNT
jgi:hypothetical protein